MAVDQPSVEEGETIRVSIHSKGDKGDGIATLESGFVLIVSDGVPGETHLVRITEVRERFAFAESIDTISD